MATIKEIAEMAGVSRGTVDRVLNNRGSVHPKTAEKIKELVKSLNYVPNKAGVALAAQKKNLKLGVILFNSRNPFLDELIQGIQAKTTEFSGYNCTITLIQVNFDVYEQLTAIESLVSEGINGLVLTPYNDPLISVKINALSEQGIPVVTTNTDIQNSRRLAYVGSHYYRSGETAAGLMALMTSGDVNIGIITGSSKILCHTERIAGFEKRIQEAYPHLNVISIIENKDDEIESYTLTLDLLTQHPEINALFFSAGGVYGGCRAVQALGRKGIKIITYDKVDTTVQMLQENIIAATICQEPYVQGTKPFDLLFNYLTTGDFPDEEYYYTSIDIRILENL
ncbi:MAG: LacI family DNA-binding transcriptional regulator [Cellulosilyticaceae bacterium]